MHWFVFGAIGVLITFIISSLVELSTGGGLVVGMLVGGLAGIAAIAYEEYQDEVR